MLFTDFYSVSAARKQDKEFETQGSASVTRKKKSWAEWVEEASLKEILALFDPNEEIPFRKKDH